MIVMRVCANGCLPLCNFDAARTEECHVSREYAAALIRAYDTGPWGTIVSQHAQCEADLANCKVMADCEIDGGGRCAARRSWVVGKLVQPESEGGAGLNSDRCGIFGQMLGDGASCLPTRDSTSCANAVGASSGAPCVWDKLRGVCDASRQGLLLVLRRDYRDELARVSLRRDRCLARARPACSGDCHLVNGTCTLRTLDALLAVVGEDCPLSTLLRQNANCWDAEDLVSCEAKVRPDGIPECDWRNNQCEAHPIALEFDLLLTVGLGQPGILTPMREAQARCVRNMGPTSCGVLCAPAVGPPSAAAWQRPSCTALLLSAIFGLLVAP